MQPLATLIQAVARAGRGEDAQAMADFERFLRTASADRTISPEMAITVGEAFLQRLILFGHFETARKANALLVRAFTAPRVGKHFAARAAGLAMLGKPAPPIEGVDIQSQPIRMADFKGKVVLIEFWSVISPASAAEMSHLNSLAELYGEKGFAVLGVNLDVLREGPGAVEIVRRFLAERGVDWPSVINPRSARDAKLAFGVTEVPARFLVDRDGKIINVELTAAELDKVVPKAVEAKAVKAPAPADRR
jgi:peroxiredoxin